MPDVGIEFFYFLLAFVLALFAVLLFLRMAGQHSRDKSHYRTLLSKPRTRLEPFEDEFVSILTYEDRYRPFTDILGLVLQKFPARRFSDDPDFCSAVRFLALAAFRPADRVAAESAMCAVVYLFLDDPEVEYRCREELSPLLDAFLTSLVPESNPPEGV